VPMARAAVLAVWRNVADKETFRLLAADFANQPFHEQQYAGHGGDLEAGDGNRRKDQGNHLFLRHGGVDGRNVLFHPQEK